MTDAAIAFLPSEGGLRLAYRRREGRGPAIVFLPGYASDMEGAKAVALDAFAARHSCAFLRFDYSGTGSSDGEFEDGTLDRWTDDARLMVEQLTDGPVVLVGSSMGGWIALHLAQRMPERVAAVMGIAAAPDFTEWGFPDHLKERLAAGETLRREFPTAAYRSRPAPSGPPARQCGCSIPRSRSTARSGSSTAIATRTSRSKSPSVSRTGCVQPMCR